MYINGKKVLSIVKTEQVLTPVPNIIYKARNCYESVNLMLKKYLDNEQNIFNDYTTRSSWDYYASALTINNNKVTCITDGDGGVGYAYKNGGIVENDQIYLNAKIDYKETNQAHGIGVGFTLSEQTAYTGAAHTLTVWFSGNSIKCLINGTSQNIVNNITLSGIYDISIFYYKGIYSISIVDENNNEYFYKTDSPAAPYGLYMLISDARGTSGHSINNFYVAGDFSKIIVNKKAVLWNSTTNANYRVYIPTNYSVVAENKAILFFHGHGSNETDLSQESNYVKIQKALVNEGYIVIGVCFKNSTTTWGSKNSTNAYWEALLETLNNFAISNISIFANSMGGIESLNFLSENHIKINSWVGTSPTFNLSNNYNETFSSYIDASYEIDSNNNYAKMTNGRDPFLQNNITFGCIPMLILVGTADNIVNPNDNGIALYNKVYPVSMSQLITVENGGHAFDISPYLDTIINFYNNCFEKY